MAVYWPLFGRLLSRLLPAFHVTLGILSLFWPSRAKRCPEGVPKPLLTGRKAAGSVHQTKQRVFWPELSRTLFSRQESDEKVTFCHLFSVQAAPLVGSGWLPAEEEAGFPGKHGKSRLLPAHRFRWAPRRVFNCISVRGASRRLETGRFLARPGTRRSAKGRSPQ